MELEKRVDQRGTNECLLVLGFDKIRNKNKIEKTNQRIKNFVYYGVGVSAFIGSYIFFSKHPEYISQIKSTVNNLIEAFRFY